MKLLKKLTIITTLTALAALISPLSLTAQNKNKGVPINVSQTGDDAVGKAFAYDVKNEIGHSSLFQNSNEDLGFHLDILSISDAVPASPNYSSAFSIALTFNSGEGVYFFDHWVMDVGSNRTVDMAKQLMVRVNDDMDLIRTEWKKLAQTGGQQYRYTDKW